MIYLRMNSTPLPFHITKIHTVYIFSSPLLLLVSHDQIKFSAPCDSDTFELYCPFKIRDEFPSPDKTTNNISALLSD